MKPVTLAPGLTLIHGDCMKLLEQTPDKYYDLGICDPPYGIGYSRRVAKTSKSIIRYTPKKWDDATPDQGYFTELFRTSANQLVFGGNYFSLPPSRGFVIWDKCQPEGLDQAMCEYVWSSFDRSAKLFRTSIQQIQFTRIHPTQKPVALYRWLLQNYAKPGQTILDTHMGSGSSAIAAWEMGYSFTGIEIDKDYFDAAVERIQKRLLSPYLPGIAGNEGKGQVEQVKLFCD